MITHTLASTAAPRVPDPGSRLNWARTDTGARGRRTAICAALAFLVLLALPAIAQAQTISTYAGGGASYGEGGPATAAQLNVPYGIALDAAGNLYVVDAVDSVVRRIDALTGEITTIAGTQGAFGYSGDGALATLATLNFPCGVAVDADGNVFIVDQFNNVIRKVDKVTGLISTVAGGGTSLLVDGVSALSASLIVPTGVAVDAAGNLYIADTTHAAVRKVDATGVITNIGGLYQDIGGFHIPSHGYGGDGGPATAAALYAPQSVAVDTAGNVYVLDFIPAAITTTTDVYIVRRIDTTGIITTIAGNGAGTGESGLATGADLGFVNNNGAIALDGHGNLYIAGTYRLWKVVLATNAISVIAGTGAAGSSGDGGLATLATFGELGGVAVAGDGSIYVSDAANARIRKIAAPVVVPPADIVVDGTTTQATLNGLVALPGGLSVVNTSRTDLILPGLTWVNGSLTVTGNSSLIDLSVPALGTVGSVLISGNPLLNAVNLNGLTTVVGNVTVTNNVAATNVSAGNPTTTTSGNVAISGNTSATSADVVASTISGSIDISGNTAATTVGVSVSSSISGNVTISGNTSATSVTSAGSATSIGGSVTITGNTSATSVTSAGSATSIGGSVTITGNTSATSVTSAGSATSIGGSVTITGNTSATSVTSAGSATSIGGSVTITDNGSAAVIVGAATGTTVSGGTTITTGGASADYSSISTTGSVSITGNGTTTVSAQTGATGTTTVSLVNGEAAMTAALPVGAFTSPVQFSIQHLDPATLTAAPGTSATSVPVTVDPVSAYQFTFKTPTLNSPATLTFEINVGALTSADQVTFLAALAAGNATIAVLADGGSGYQAFPVCATGQLPAGGCAQIVALDATKTPLLPGDPATPAYVRFTGIAGHFSTYAVVVLSPIAPTIATIANQSGTQGVAFSFAPNITNPSALALAFSSAGAALPGGLSVNAGTGAIAGTPTVSGTFAGIQLRATYADGSVTSNAFSIVLSATAPTIAAIANQAGTQGVAFSFAPAVTNPSALTLTFSNVGLALPAGLSVNAGTGAIAGTPTVSGTFAGVQLRATYTGGSVTSNAFSLVLSPASSTTGSSRTICTTLGGTRLPDIDLFQFTASAGEKVTVTLAANPAGSYVNGSALLALFGPSVLKTDASALPNVVSATLSRAGTDNVTVSELLVRTGKFTGAYCVTLTSSKGAWQTFVKR